MRPLTTLFPSKFLEEHAEEPDMVKREDRLQIPSSCGRSCSASPRRKPNTRWIQTQLQLDGQQDDISRRLLPSVDAVSCRVPLDLVEAILDKIAVSDNVDTNIDRFRDIMIVVYSVTTNRDKNPISYLRSLLLR